MRNLAFIPLLALAAAVQAAPDAKAGKALHDKQCVACHVKMFGGDGSKIYTRSPRLINDPAALRQRVAACSAQTGAKWFPEEEENVAAYLAQQFYKFK
ncbi:MAG: cytochrome c [Sterolibacteriaceae bacterium MAG5]|nr:cytochrome c [Candidatus Nitricoxidireducens bremensis]